VKKITYLVRKNYETIHEIPLSKIRYKAIKCSMEANTLEISGGYYIGIFILKDTLNENIILENHDTELYYDSIIIEREDNILTFNTVQIKHNKQGVFEFTASHTVKYENE
jgi:hypothetical protein